MNTCVRAQRFLLVSALLCLASAPARAAVPACAEGQEKGPNTEGHCCWPGQWWDGHNCVGTPTRCPESFVVRAQECALLDCATGQARVDGRHCCWPKQSFDAGRKVCVGTPACPTGLQAMGTTCLNNPAGIDWVRVAGGSFDMGSVEHGDPALKPVREVTLRPFFMARSETTVGQYQKCVKAGVCDDSPWDNGACYVTEAAGSSRKALPEAWRSEKQPAVCLDWWHARAFCEWAGGRLPSEAQWEYAARSGGRAQPFPWGAARATCERTVVATGDGAGCGKGAPWPVCSKATDRSAQGLCDLAGNVWEWVQDDYHVNYEGGPEDGSAWEDAGVADRKVLRGASFVSVDPVTDAYMRTHRQSDDLDSAIGFRCVRAE